MKAYELYRNDQVNGNELVRSAADRREYYVALRQALREECAGGKSCELLTRLGERAARGELTRLYLLDAAAVWECYEATIDGIRFMRDAARFPFVLEEGTLTWRDVERLAAAGTLPAAVVDQELQSRLDALLRYADGKGRLKARPQVNSRATLKTAPADGGAAQAPAGGRTEADDRQLAELRARLEKLSAENASLRGQMEQMSACQDITRAHAARAAQSILAGKNEEARAIAGQLDEKLQAGVRELEQNVALRRELEERMTRLQEQLEVDRIQLRELQRQAEQAEKEAAEIRGEREKAQRRAVDALREEQLVRAELDAARTQLERDTETLRGLRMRVDGLRKARDMTRRQIDGLSENL